MNTGNQSNPDSSPPEDSGNCTFRVAARILGVIILLSIAGLAGYALLILPTQRGAQQAATAPVIQNTLVAQALTSIAGILGLPTATITPPPSQEAVITTAGTSTAQTLSIQTVTITQRPTRTPVVAQATATVSAALTPTAVPQLTPVPSSTALPGTGIGDQYGPSGLVVGGIALVGVIFLARWLRLGAAQE